MLAAMHKGMQHTGKIPGCLKESLVTDALCKDLNTQLERAIREEKYEEAARLRDCIREATHAAG
jgi:protein-arginine kinase activator protein McsA